MSIGKLLGFFLILVGPASIKAQVQNPLKNFYLLGVAVDSVTSKRIDGASVALYNQEGKTVKRDITRSEGFFKIPVQPGQLSRLEIIHLNFKKKTILLNLSGNPDSLDLGYIFLSPAVNELKEVSISAKKTIVNYGLNKISYEVALDSSNKGASALDMIQKVPLVEVANNQLLASGKSNVKLFLDGKEIGSSSSYYAFLKSLPASSFSKVEVNTSPEIRYQQEGVSTIINLSSDKKIPKGIFAGVNTSLSSRLGYSYGGFSMARLNNLYVVATLNRDVFGKPVESETTQEFYGNDNSILSSLLTYSKVKNSSLLTDINATYNINSKSSVRLALNHFSVASYNEFSLKNNEPYGNLNLKNVQAFYNLETDYELVGKNKNVFSLALKLMHDNQEQNVFSGNGESKSNSLGNEYTAQADYIIPLENWKFDFGTKLLHRKINRWGIVPVDGYFQDIFRIYSSASYNITKRQKISLGVISDAARFESNTKQNYYNLLFQGNYSFMAGKNTNISLSFDEQVKRPGLKYVAPSVLLALPENLFAGNQDLAPELIYSYKIMLNGILLKKPASISFYLTQIPRSITEVKEISNTRILTTYLNNANFYQFGTSVFFSYPLTKKLSIKLNGDIGFQKWSGETEAFSNSGLSYKIFSTINYNNVLGFNTQLRFFNYSKVYTLQGNYGAYYDSQLSVSKTLFKERVACKATLYQPFLVAQEVKSIFKSPSTSYLSTNLTPVRYFNLSVNYELGNVSKAMSTRSQKGKRAENDDIKIP